MSIQYVAGDLFVNVHEVQALAQGCNCIGVMGAGIAIGMREHYPWKAADVPWVFNLATQKNTSTSRAQYPHIETSLREMRRLADAEGIESIAMPRIGAGLGGLSWAINCYLRRHMDAKLAPSLGYFCFNSAAILAQRGDKSPSK